MELSHTRQSTLQVLQAQTERVQAHLMPCKQLCRYISTKKSLSTLLWEHERNEMHGCPSKGRFRDLRCIFPTLVEGLDFDFYHPLAKPPAFIRSDPILQ